jgi:subtilisin family serine protease
MSRLTVRVLLASGFACSMLSTHLFAGNLSNGGQSTSGQTLACDEPWIAEWRQSRNDALAADPTLEFDPTSLLVQFAPGTTQAEINAALLIVGGQTIETFDLVPDLAHITTGMTVPDAIQILNDFGNATGIVVYAEPDDFYHTYATPNDTFYSLEWGLNNTGQTVASTDTGTANADIDANLAWDVTTGSSSFVVGMADSGILRTHEDLAANIWTNPGEVAGNGIDDDGNGRIDDTWGWDFWNNDNNPTDDNGHGTHTAGTVGAVGNNAKGVAGVCWNVKLAGLKIGSASGSISTSAAVSALGYCTGKGIKVSNHSWGGGASNASLNTAITNARTAGHLLICASGNGGADGRGDNNNTTPQYPASYTQDNIIAVAAIDNDNRLATFSNYGSTSVDLAAPGVNIASTYNSATNAYIYLNGTSMATPHVTGVAALVWGRNPTWTYSQVRSKLLSTTKPLSSLTGRCVTGGCVNANNAVR